MSNINALSKWSSLGAVCEQADKVKCRGCCAQKKKKKKKKKKNYEGRYSLSGWPGEGWETKGPVVGSSCPQTCCRHSGSSGGAASAPPREHYHWKYWVTWGHFGF